MQRMNRGIFITGTDTGVGKTWIGAGIATSLRTMGIDVGVMKPAETGCRAVGSRLVPADATALARAAQVKDSIDIINPYRFKAPLAPLVAAELEGVSINIRKIKSSFNTLRRKHDFLIVEGAGGIMVPLTPKYAYIDLAELLHLPVLVVARPSLGTINHTVLTVSALRARNITVVGIVINDSLGKRKGPAEKTNPAVIEHMTGLNIIEMVKYGQHDMSKIAQSLIKKDVNLKAKTSHRICGQFA